MYCSTDWAHRYRLGESWRRLSKIAYERLVGARHATEKARRMLALSIPILVSETPFPLPVEQRAKRLLAITPILRSRAENHLHSMSELRSL